MIQKLNDLECREKVLFAATILTVFKILVKRETHTVSVYRDSYKCKLFLYERRIWIQTI